MIEQTLKTFGIKSTKAENRILAIEEIYNPDTDTFSNGFVDVTDWTEVQLLEWLGL